MSEELNFEIPECPFNWSSGFERAPGMLDNTPTDDLEFLAGTGPLILEITLRSDVRFSDGSRFTAYDVQDFISNVKQTSSDTLVYKQWEAVVYTVVVNATKIEFHMSLPETYGFINFMYSLTAPIASIVKLEGEEVVGTGAYTIADHDENCATLELRDDWWKETLETRVNSVTFRYFSEAGQCLREIADNFVALSIAEGNVNSISNNIINGNLRLDKQIATNPIVLLINSSSEALSELEIREAFFLSLDVNKIITYDYWNLLGASHDYWTHDGHNYTAPYYTDGDYAEGAYRILEYWGLEENEKYALSLAITSDGNFNLANRMQELLEDSRFDVTLEYMSEENYKTCVENRTYQLTLQEIDLSDIDSAYKLLYGTSTENMDNILNQMKIAAKLSSFQRMQLYAQAERVNNVESMVVGWKYKSIVSNNDVIGIKIAWKYNPISMMSYVDLRGIDFASNW